MADVRLETPRVTVLLEDGQVLTAQVMNPDYLRWDRTAAKHGWPSMAKVPHTWLTFVSWSALRREGKLPQDVTWEDFSERMCLQVQNARDEPGNGSLAAEDALAAVGAAAPEVLDFLEAAQGADPTPPGPEPG